MYTKLKKTASINTWSNFTIMSLNVKVWKLRIAHPLQYIISLNDSKNLDRSVCKGQGWKCWMLVSFRETLHLKTGGILSRKSSHGLRSTSRNHSSSVSMIQRWSYIWTWSRNTGFCSDPNLFKMDLDKSKFQIDFVNMLRPLHWRAEGPPSFLTALSLSRLWNWQLGTIRA